MEKIETSEGKEFDANNKGLQKAVNSLDHKIKKFDLKLYLQIVLFGSIVILSGFTIRNSGYLSDGIHISSYHHTTILNNMSIQFCSRMVLGPNKTETTNLNMIFVT